MLNVLQEYAGLPVGRLTEIWRQQHKGYKAVVADIAAGKREKAFDGLAYLGWVKQVESDAPLVDDYLAGLRAGKTQLLVVPTHAHGDAVTAAIRGRLRADGKLGVDHVVEQFVNRNCTAAEKADLERYDGSEVLVFHRNSGTFRAGDVVPVKDLTPDRHYRNTEHFSVYTSANLAVAAGDLIRVTANGKTVDGHRLNNGAVYRVKGFDKKGAIVLDNDWVVPSDVRHLRHGYVATSPGSQGKTVDRVLIAMGSESRGALNAEQFYVSVSRGRQSAKVYTDLPADELKTAIQRTDKRKSATELMHPKRRARQPRIVRWMEKARDRFRRLREMTAGVTKERQRDREYAHE